MLAPHPQVAAGLFLLELQDPSSVWAPHMATMPTREELWSYYDVPLSYLPLIQSEPVVGRSRAGRVGGGCSRSCACVFACRARLKGSAAANVRGSADNSSARTQAWRRLSRLRTPMQAAAITEIQSTVDEVNSQPASPSAVLGSMSAETMLIAAGSLMYLTAAVSAGVEGVPGPVPQGRRAARDERRDPLRQHAGAR